MNVCPDLHGFERIVPCGITDKRLSVISMAQLLTAQQETTSASSTGDRTDQHQKQTQAKSQWAHLLQEPNLLLQDVTEHLQSSFQEVFKVKLVQRSEAQAGQGEESRDPIQEATEKLRTSAQKAPLERSGAAALLSRRRIQSWDEAQVKSRKKI